MKRLKKHFFNIWLTFLTYVRKMYPDEMKSIDYITLIDIVLYFTYPKYQAECLHFDTILHEILPSFSIDLDT